MKIPMALLYFNMTCLIKIGNVEFTSVNSVEIVESIKNISNTGTIILPRNYSRATINGKIESLEGKEITNFINEADPVEIYLGYDEDLALEFKGYVASIGADIPLVIDVEDEMYLLKKTTYTKTLKDAKLSDLLAFVAPNYEYEIIDDIPLGKFQIKNASAYEVFEALRKDYLLHTYYRNDKIVVGFPSDIRSNIIHKYNLYTNVRDYSRLKFVTAKNLKLQIKSISNNRNGSKEVVTVGETGGSTRTLNFANKSKTELKKIAEANLKSLVFDGFQGSFDAFGLPRPKAGDIAQIIDPEFENSNRSGSYLIEGVTKSFNRSDGFNNEVKLSLKV